MESALTQERIDATEQNAAVLIAMLEHKKLKYKIEEQTPGRTHIRMHFSGEDLPMTLHIILRADKQIATVFSVMPFRMSADRIQDAAIAVAAATYGLIDGSFDLNPETGEIRFRLTSCYKGALLSEALYSYLMYVSAETVDRYNDRFQALNEGSMTLTDFLNADSADEGRS